MIPEFPEFKKLELSDKKDIEKLTEKYPPYSDFNFVSMWSWDIKDEMRLSLLNGNLVVRFTDYLTGEPFYSFLGDNKVNETVNTLLNFSVEKELKPKLYLVPENTILKLDKNKFSIEEDIDNFDYIFDLHGIEKYDGGQFVKKRHKVKQLLKTYPKIQVEVIDIKKDEIEKMILKLDELWLNNKIEKDINFKIKNELLATSRFFQLKTSFDNIFSVGVFLDKKMLGYSICDIVPNNYAISHFTKADTQFTGIYDFLMKEISKMLIGKECFFLNYEQDLGLPGLRISKKSFMSNYLKKFTIGFTH